MSSQPEEGKEKCPYGPTTGYTGLIVGKALLPSSSLWSMDLNTAAVRGFKSPLGRSVWTLMWGSCL